MFPMFSSLNNIAIECIFSFFLSFFSVFSYRRGSLPAPVDDDYGDVKSFLEIENPFYAING